MSLSSNNLFASGKLYQYVFIFAFAIAACVALPVQLKAQTQTPAEKKPVVFTQKDREFALKYLKENREEFLKALSDLSEAQLNYKSAPDKWSIAEVAEHIIIVENRLFPLITEKILKAPAPEGKDNFRITDRTIILTATNRNQKFQAPESVQPNGRWKTKAEIISGFEKARTQTTSFVETTTEDLRNHFGDNPLLGVIDGYQWFIFLPAHSERHLAQIAEIKSTPNFPKK